MLEALLRDHAIELVSDVRCLFQGSEVKIVLPAPVWIALLSDKCVEGI